MQLNLSFYLSFSLSCDHTEKDKVSSYSTYSKIVMGSNLLVCCGLLRLDFACSFGEDGISSGAPAPIHVQLYECLVSW